MKLYSKINLLYILALVLVFFPSIILAANLSVSPATGVYSAGTSFTAKVIVNTQGKPINAAEGTLKFNPNEMSVVSVNRSASIFNLWVTEPTFSNSAGTISFSGGMPSGYTGGSGTIFTVTFRTTNAGTARLSLTGGSVLANDGMGTNVLSGMSGGTFTINAPFTSPVPEVVEYVAPANTPGTPKISSGTHQDSSVWYQTRKAVLSWDLPAGITEVRTLLDKSANSIPTKVYSDPIRTITIDDLDEGVSFFHLQFKNNDGWGRVAHYRLAVDTEKPSEFTISSASEDVSNPNQILRFEAKDATSDINRYKIKINNDEPYEYIDKENTKLVTLPTLSPGYYALIVEAFDEAGNSIISSHSFTIESFAKPVFTDYPSEINEEVIPVIKGQTKPNAEVTISLNKIGSDAVDYLVQANDSGIFIFIPEGTFSTGVYELQAKAKDSFGAESEPSEKIRIAVQTPGYMQIGSFIINILSVVIPLMALVFLLVFASLFMVTYLRRFRKKVSIESAEVAQVLVNEFSSLQNIVTEKQSEITGSRKSKKLTKLEEDLFTSLHESLENSKNKIKKEVSDVEGLVKK